MLDIEIKLKSFEGPLDLLFKLIEKNKINIYDIPIVKLTEQYIDYIKSFPENMDSISEFLLMAATLLEIKSKMLLPKIKENIKEEKDPREELVNKLIEYKKFKQISIKLKKMFLQNENIFFKVKKEEFLKNIKEKTHFYENNCENNMEKITLEILYKTFLDVINRKELKIDKIRSNFNSIKKDNFTIKEKIEYIIYMIEKNKKLNIKNIFNNYSSKEEKVVTFIAILELVKTKNIKVEQQNIFEDIIISKY